MKPRSPKSKMGLQPLIRRQTGVFAMFRRAATVVLYCFRPGTLIEAKVS
jgi:hypothetical protein